ncbi:MAG: 4-hydroxybutyryl-CoA dehydratase, partial [Candidatus Lokiarchaeota archaeon]|nr:4-hydroxybutyryl-CoA dehydratase [Candidatus Lokiarchaeota archaeon]
SAISGVRTGIDDAMRKISSNLAFAYSMHRSNVSCCEIFRPNRKMSFAWHREPSGTYLVDLLLANVHKQNITRFPYEIARLAQDIAGGLLVTLPSTADFESPEVGKWVEKYTTAKAGVPAEDRCRMLRLIENITMGAAAVGYLTESMHGAGSPQAQRIMIGRLANLKEKQAIAKKLCGIDKPASTD